MKTFHSTSKIYYNYFQKLPVIFSWPVAPGCRMMCVSDENFAKIKSIIKDLKIVNALAEGCMKDTQEYSDFAKECQFEKTSLLSQQTTQDLQKGVLAKLWYVIIYGITILQICYTFFFEV